MKDGSSDGGSEQWRRERASGFRFLNPGLEERWKLKLLKNRTHLAWREFSRLAEQRFSGFLRWVQPRNGCYDSSYQSSKAIGKVSTPALEASTSAMHQSWWSGMLKMGNELKQFFNLEKSILCLGCPQKPDSLWGKWMQGGGSWNWQFRPKKIPHDVLAYIWKLVCPGNSHLFVLSATL